MSRFGVLDGWRAIAILMVLATHLLPIGPKILRLNAATGIAGMAIFFCLSGFLMTHFLIKKPDVMDFLVRRLFRILPLAWLYMGLVLWLYPVSTDAWFAHMLFYANYPPKPLISVTDHMWSLCVEMHFYIGIALLVLLTKRHWMWFLPLLCVGFTLLRVFNGMYWSVISHYRVDEILVGGVIALLYHEKLFNPQLSQKMVVWIGKLPFILILVLFLLSAHTVTEALNYFRPYFAAILIAITLFHAKHTKLLESKILAYIAAVSYAIYVWHLLLANTWLGSGVGWDKYSKRPLLFLAIFVVAHISTFYYEKYFIDFGKKISDRYFSSAKHKI